MNEQVHQFCESESAFMMFKKNSTIDKTLKSYNNFLSKEEELKRSKNEAQKVVKKAKKLLLLNHNPGILKKLANLEHQDDSEMAK